MLKSVYNNRASHFSPYQSSLVCPAMDGDLTGIYCTESETTAQHVLSWLDNGQDPEFLPTLPEQETTGLGQSSAQASQSKPRNDKACGEEGRKAKRFRLRRESNARSQKRYQDRKKVSANQGKTS